MLEADRIDINVLNTELRQAKAELDRIQRAKRATETKPQFQPAPPMQYYQGYTYGYPHAYTSSFRAATTSYPPPSTTTTTTAATTTTTTATVPATSTATAAAYTPVSGAIPVQLPISLLPSLNTLGINPVPPPAQGQPPAAAVLQGSNGTMVNLLFDVSLLQSHQMTGLAMILNSLMATGINAHSSTPVDPTTAMRGAASVVSQQHPQIQPYGSTVANPSTGLSGGATTGSTISANGNAIQSEQRG